MSAESNSTGMKRTLAISRAVRSNREEAEQVILNYPLDLGMEVAEGEERHVNLGPTSRGRILLVVTTWREYRVRVVTAFEPIKRLVHFYFKERGR